MKYKQVCPNCYYENKINDLTYKLLECPICKDTGIADVKCSIIDEELEDNCKKFQKENVSDKKENISEQEEVVVDLKCFAEELGILKNNDKSDSVLGLKFKSGNYNDSFEIKIYASDCPAIIGRSGEGREYLKYDLRVGNEHCFIDFIEGEWKVKDNYSKNTTQLNGQILKSGEYFLIKNGDYLKLGNMMDSFLFEVIVYAIG